MNKIITFKKVRAPYGWMSNMSPHPITVAMDLQGQERPTYHTAEHLFQCMRFVDPAIKAEIMAPKSPMAAKMVAKKYADKMAFKPRSPWDNLMMESVLRLKLEAHPYLKAELLATGDATIIEDVSSRPNESGLYWGMALINNEWVGQNVLGKLWMNLRTELSLLT